MSYNINYPESPLFLLAKALDEGLTELAQHACHRLGPQYLVKPKDVQFTVLTWFGMQTAMREPPEASIEYLEAAFKFVCDPKRMEELRQLLEAINKKIVNIDAAKASAQVADAFSISEAQAVLVLGLRYAILRPGAK